MVVALTNINHDGQWVDAGTEVDESTFPDMTEEQMDALVESGAVGEPVAVGADAKADATAQLAEVDKMLQEKYGLTLDEVLATEDTEGGAEVEPAAYDEGSPDGV